MITFDDDDSDGSISSSSGSVSSDQKEDALDAFMLSRQNSIDDCGGEIYTGKSSPCLSNSELYDRNNSIYEFDNLVQVVKDIPNGGDLTRGFIVGTDEFSGDELRNDYDIEQVGYLDGDQDRIYFVLTKYEWSESERKYKLKTLFKGF